MRAGPFSSPPNKELNFVKIVEALDAFVSTPLTHSRSKNINRTEQFTSTTQDHSSISSSSNNNTTTHVAEF
jgi:hypothetical protein